MGSFGKSWGRDRTERELQNILQGSDLTQRLEATDPTSRLVDVFLERLQKRLGQSVSAAVTIAGQAPILGRMAESTATAGRELSQAADTIASTSEEVSTTLASELVPGANDMARLSREVASSVRQCETGIDQTLGHFGAINRSERDLEGAIGKLQEQLEEVTNVIGVIAEISKQTNLLSLNAAIEAARAGAHGAGFAVVAEEVRRLAQHATESTNQVSDIVQQFRADMTQLTSAGSQMQQAVSAGEAGVEQMRTELSKARSAMDDLDTRVSSIASGTEQIGAAVSAMNNDVHTVADAAGELLGNAEKMGETSAAIHDQSNHLLEGLGGFHLDLHKQARQTVVRLAQKSALRAGSEAQAERELEQALAQDNRFELLYLVGRDGKQLTANCFAQDLSHLDGTQARGKDWRQRHWFKAVLESKQPHITDVYRSAATEAFCFTVAVPIVDDRGELVRVLGADLRLSALTS